MLADCYVLHSEIESVYLEEGVVSTVTHVKGSSLLELRLQVLPALQGVRELLKIIHSTKVRKYFNQTDLEPDPE